MGLNVNSRGPTHGQSAKYLWTPEGSNKASIWVLFDPSGVLTGFPFHPWVAPGCTHGYSYSSPLGWERGHMLNSTEVGPAPNRFYQEKL